MPLHFTDLCTLQVQLLLCYAQSDTRKVIRRTSLLELLQLAVDVPHTWTADMIQVCVFASLLSWPSTVLSLSLHFSFLPPFFPLSSHPLSRFSSAPLYLSGTLIYSRQSCLGERERDRSVCSLQTHRNTGCTQHCSFQRYNLHPCIT